MKSLSKDNQIVGEPGACPDFLIHKMGIILIVSASSMDNIRFKCNNIKG
jgi:hypothetical protein